MENFHKHSKGVGGMKIQYRKKKGGGGAQQEPQIWRKRESKKDEGCIAQKIEVNCKEKRARDKREGAPPRKLP